MYSLGIDMTVQNLPQGVLLDGRAVSTLEELSKCGLMNLSSDNLQALLQDQKERLTEQKRKLESSLENKKLEIKELDESIKKLDDILKNPSLLNPENLSFPQLQDLFKNKPAYLLFNDEIYFVGIGVKPIKLHVTQEKVDDEGFVILPDVKKLFPDNNDTLQFSTEENLKLIQELTGHTRSYRIRTTPPPIINLVFQGGGAQGGVYVGAHKYLQETNQLSGIKTLSGSSAGAITDLLIALGLTSKEIKQTLDRDFAADKIMVNEDNRFKLIKDGSGLRNMLISVIQRRLWDVFCSQSDAFEEIKNNNKLFYDRFLKIISGETDFTFQDLQCLTQYFPNDFKQLVAGAVDRIEKNVVVFSASSTPNVSIAKVVRASASLPGVFAPEMIDINGQEREFIDCGVWDNMPFAFLEGREYRDDIPFGHRDDFGQNPQTRCIGIAGTDDQEKLLHRRDKSPNFWWIVSYLLGRLLTGIPFGRKDQDMWRRLDEGYSHQSILIDPVGVGVTSFSLTPEQKNAMETSGYQTMQHHDACYGQADSIEYEYDSLFEMLIGLDQKNVDALIQQGQWADDQSGCALQIEYEAAIEIRHMLYGPLEPFQTRTFLQKIKEKLTFIENNLHKLESVHGARYLIGETLNEILKPLEKIEDPLKKERYQQAVLNKINYECHNQLVHVALGLDKLVSKEENKDKKPLIIDRYGFYAKKELIENKIRSLASQMKRKMKSSQDVNWPLVQNIHERLQQKDLNNVNLAAILNDICEKYQRRTFPVLTKIFPPNSVIEAQLLREEILTLKI